MSVTESMIQTGVGPAKVAFRLLQPGRAKGAEARRVSEAYRCWQTVWSETLRELDDAPRVYSDDFMRQDELGALFHEDRCIGLSCFRWVDLAYAHNRDDSYFKAWPETAIHALMAAGSNICIGSNLTVLREWRGASPGFSVKSVLMALAVKRFLASDADAMAGTMRNDRGMNHLVYHLGAKPLVRDAVHHGVNVDLVSFPRQIDTDRWSGVDCRIAESLWQQTTPVTSLSRLRVGG